MNHLRRELAPVTDAAWEAIDEEAVRVLEAFLSARRVVDFTGPLGWDSACVGTGRVDALEPAPAEGVEGATRASQPLIELSAGFELARRELDAVDRGAADPDLAPVIDAARRIARAEDGLAFHGRDDVGIRGLLTASPHEDLEIDVDDYTSFPAVVARGVEMLRDAGVDGPYAVALGPGCHRGVVEGTEKGGYPVLRHVELITGGPLVRAPTIDGAALISLRGGDFELVCGQDLSIGYRSHTDDTVTLYFEETVTFRNFGPEAAVALRHD